LMAERDHLDGITTGLHDKPRVTAQDLDLLRRLPAPELQPSPWWRQPARPDRGIDLGL
jgi:hypothetical protein